VDASRIGAVGFCMGGGYALLYAVRAPLGVTAVFYGDVPKTPRTAPRCLPRARRLRRPRSSLRQAGARLEALLRELGVPHDVRIYPDAGHSYMSPHTGMMATIGAWGPMAVGYDPAAAADSWARIESFFKQHLG
jgi:carboxymethylenebutenolidase